MRNKAAEFSANCVPYWRDTWSSVQLCVSPSRLHFWPLASAPPLLQWFYLWKWALWVTCLVPPSLCKAFQALQGFDLCLCVPFAHWKIFSVAGLSLSQFQDLNNENLGASWSFSSGLCVPVLGSVDRQHPWLSLHYSVNEMWRACCSQHGNTGPPAALSAVFWYLKSWVWITDDRIFLLGYVCQSHTSTGVRVSLQNQCACFFMQDLCISLRGRNAKFIPYSCLE